MLSRDEKEKLKQIKREEVTKNIKQQYPNATGFEVLTLVGLELSNKSKVNKK